MGLTNQVADLLVDLVSNLRTVFQGAAATATGERITLLLTVFHGAHLRAHAILSDHRAGNLGRLLNVVRRTGSGLAKHNLFSRAAAHCEHDAGEQLVAVVHALIVLLGSHRMPTGLAAGKDRHLIDALDVLHRPRSNRVTTLVISGDLLLLLRDDLGGTTRATNHTVSSLFQSIASDDVTAHTSGQQCSLVEHIGQVRTRHTRGALSQRLQISVLGERLTLSMNLQDLLAAFQIRVSHRDLTVETPRTQQSLVQNIRAVGGSNKDDALAVAETIHLHQQLVQCLLALVMATAHTGATLTTHGVNLINENNAGAVFLRLLKQVTHSRSTHADEHLNEVRTRNREERHPGFTGDSSRQQGFTRTGRAIQQHTARNLRAQSLVAGRILQEILDLLQLINCLIGPRDVIKSVGRHILGQFLRTGTTNAKHAHSATLHAGDHERDQTKQDQHRQQHLQHRTQEGIAGNLRGVLLRAGSLNLAENIRSNPRGVFRNDLLDAVLFVNANRVLELQQNPLLAISNTRFFNVLIVQLLHRHRRVDGPIAAASVTKNGEHVQGHQHNGRNGTDAQKLLIVHR